MCTVPPSVTDAWRRRRDHRDRAGSCAAPGLDPLAPMRNDPAEIRGRVLLRGLHEDGLALGEGRRIDVAGADERPHG
jgi:hypothetical protein